MRKITKIIVHCSDSSDALDIGAKEITDWHLKRGFDTIGYHYVIRIDGTKEIGRPVEIPGAHCEGENHDSLGVCLVGRNNFSIAQVVSFTELILDLLKTHMLHVSDVYTHDEFDHHGKTCPNIPPNVMRFLLALVKAQRIEREKTSVV